MCLTTISNQISFAQEGDDNQSEIDAVEQPVKLEEQNNFNAELFNAKIEKEDIIQTEELSTDTETLQGSVEELSRFERFKHVMKGEKPKNLIAAGMWSKHFSSSKNYREVHNLGGLQYNGIFAGTFTNSHSKQVFTIAIARTIMKKQLKKDLLFDVGYKIGPMYGYKEGAPDIGGFSILPFFCLGLTYHNVGASLNLFPSSAVSFNTYINMDLFKRNKHKQSL